MKFVPTDMYPTKGTLLAELRYDLTALKTSGEPPSSWLTFDAAVAQLEKQIAEVESMTEGWTSDENLI